jgi:hypothetical protein
MNVEEIHEGLDYKVRAVNVKSTERFTVLEKKQNSRGDWEIQARVAGKPLSNIRTFTPEQFKEIDQKIEKKIISNSVKLRGKLSDGTEIWEEELINFPHQERRGRKPKVA